VKSATQFKLRDVVKRLAANRADPWAGFFDVRQSVSAKAIKMLGE
jgi:hypothetical protein